MIWHLYVLKLIWKIKILESEFEKMLKKKKIVIVAVFLMVIMFAGTWVGSVNLFWSEIIVLSNNPQNVEENY